MKHALTALQVLVCLAALALMFYVAVGGASMDATARPGTPCDFHSGAP